MLIKIRYINNKVINLIAVKSMKNLIYYLFFILFFSCHSANQNQGELEEGKNRVAEFQKIDSLTVTDVLAQVFLYQGFVGNYHVFRDMTTSEVFLFDQEGKLSKRWNKEGDVPGKFSMASSNFYFDKMGNIVVLDIMNGLKVLSLGGDVIQDFGIFQNPESHHHQVKELLSHS